MAKKIVKLTETDLENLVSRIIKENDKVSEGLPKKELDREATKWRKGDFEPYERESQLSRAFGKYSDDMSPQVISYLRKNPRKFLQRMVDIYGMDRVLDFIGYDK